MCCSVMRSLAFIAALQAWLVTVKGRLGLTAEAAGIDSKTRNKAMYKAVAKDYVGAITTLIDANLDTINTSARGVRARAYQLQQVITGLIIVITVSVSVVIVSQFNSSIGSPSNAELSSAQDSVLTGFADMVSLIGPLLLIIIAVVVVAYIQRMRQG